MTLLNNFSFKQIVLLVPMFMFIILAVSYTLSMHYIFSNTITKQMYITWKSEVASISEQARFPVITESKEGILRIVNLLNNPEIEHISIQTNNKNLYSSGKQKVCDFKNASKNSFTNMDNFFCFKQIISNKQDKNKIGEVTLIVSKKNLNSLILKNLGYNVWVIVSLTSLIFGLFYLLVNKILLPLDDLYRAMKKVSQNKRGIQLKKHGTLDMRYIQQEFNDMVKKIEQNERQLDEKVVERTLELSNAYKNAKGASKVKSDILKIVSHEMKTPLTGAMIFLDLMKKCKYDYISETIKCIDRLQILIDNLLDYSCATENKIVLKKRFFSISDFLETINVEFTPLLHANNNILTINNTCDKQIYSDKKIVKQILSNFLSNANKFTLKGSITLKCYIESDRLFMSVIDSGCGIRDIDIKKIFDPFWQVDMSSSRTFEGTGLGLSICSLFAETINATITVKSKLRHGSNFTVSFPLEQ